MTIFLTNFCFCFYGFLIRPACEGGVYICIIVYLYKLTQLSEGIAALEVIEVKGVKS